MNTDKRILSITAFALFVGGIVSPFFGRLFGSDGAAFIFSITATFLALIFGLLSRNLLLGKIAWIGALIIYLIGAINYVRFRSAMENLKESQHQELQSQYRQIKQRITGDIAPR